MRTAFLVTIDSGERRLLCACSAVLPVRSTAYGAMAVCTRCDTRWTAIRPREPIAATWVAERR
jgi:hypothetical protein